MLTNAWMLALIGLALGVGEARGLNGERLQRLSRQSIALNYHLLLAEVAHSSQVVAAPKVHTIQAAPLRAARRFGHDPGFGPILPVGFEVTYDRMAHLREAGSTINPVQHQVGIFGVPLEWRQKALPPPTSMPLGDRTELATTMARQPIAPASIVHHFASRINGEPGSPISTPHFSDYNKTSIKSIPRHISNPPRVNIVVDTGHDGRVRILGLRDDHSQVFEAFADRILFDPNEPDRVEINGNVEIHSRQIGSPARVLGARAIMNLVNGSFEVLPGGNQN